MSGFTAITDIDIGDFFSGVNEDLCGGVAGRRRCIGGHVSTIGAHIVSRRIPSTSRHEIGSRSQSVDSINATIIGRLFSERRPISCRLSFGIANHIGADRHSNYGLACSPGYNAGDHSSLDHLESYRIAHEVVSDGINVRIARRRNITGIRSEHQISDGFQTINFKVSFAVSCSTVTCHQGTVGPNANEGVRERLTTFIYNPTSDCSVLRRIRRAFI